GSGQATAASLPVSSFGLTLLASTRGGAAHVMEDRPTAINVPASTPRTSTTGLSRLMRRLCKDAARIVHASQGRYALASLVVRSIGILARCGNSVNGLEFKADAIVTTFAQVTSCKLRRNNGPIGSLT